MTTIKKIVSAIDANDIIAAVGFLMLFAGLWSVYAPSAPIVTGAILIRIAVWGR